MCGPPDPQFFVWGRIEAVTTLDVTPLFHVLPVYTPVDFAAHDEPPASPEVVTRLIQPVRML